MPAPTISAAIATSTTPRSPPQAAVAAGRRVAILDVDYHHGNGTQDIFYARGDVFFVSIHADPRTDYPFYWGHADEIGEGEGEGATLNLPLPQRQRDRTPICRRSTRRSSGSPPSAPDLLVCSLRRRHLCGDPIGFFTLCRRRIIRASPRRIAALGLPTLIVMEGGYAVDALGGNVAAFLSGF